jgi:hypothetical protein
MKIHRHAHRRRNRVLGLAALITLLIGFPPAGIAALGIAALVALVNRHERRRQQRLAAERAAWLAAPAIQQRAHWLQHLTDPHR